MGSAVAYLFADCVDDWRMSTLSVDATETALKEFFTERLMKAPFASQSFALPVQSIPRLGSFYETNPWTDPLRISILGTKDESKGWEDCRVQDAKAMNDLYSSFGERVEVASILVRMPIGPSPQTVFDSLRGFSDTNVQVILSELDSMSDMVGFAAECEWISLTFDLKLLGDPIHLARFIVECSGLEVPYQIVGLSGSALSREEEIGTLNLATAAVLAFAEELSGRETADILKDEAFESWNLKGSRLDYTGISIAPDQHQDSRSLFWGMGVVDVRRMAREIEKLV